MYLSKITIENFRCFGEADNRFELSLNPKLTALVGENDTGKTAIIDALRFVLGTTDQEWYRLEDTDFCNEGTSREIRIICKFEGLNARDKRAFVEYLTYNEDGETDPVFYVNWTAEDTGDAPKGRPYRRVEVHSGKNGDGPSIDPKARELLRATYLRPLRNADQALSAGRGSRLAQVLHHTDQVKTEGVGYDPTGNIDPKKLNVLGIGDLANSLLENQKGIKNTRTEIDTHLEGLSLRWDSLKSIIKVSGSTSSEDVRLRQLLEKLDLILGGAGKLGLGSNNLLFIACELLLLGQEDEGNKLLLIEEPSAHLHAQRQLQVMRSLQEQAKEKGIQVIITTHSPNLASAIELDNIVMVRNGRAFSLAEGETNLEPSDYKFLKRFLDVTKANLFFARGVMIVEGDAENILLPTLANILGCDFTEHGVSIVNVGGVGLRRYARIFQRKCVTEDMKRLEQNDLTDDQLALIKKIIHESQLDIPVACVTDMDVMPDCAPVIVGKIKEDDDWPEMTTRRWKAKRDFDDNAALALHRDAKDKKASGQYVKSFISDEWTLEYDLALGPKNEDDIFPGGLAEDVFIAACLAEKDDSINNQKTTFPEVEKTAIKEFGALKVATEEKDNCTMEEVLAAKIYAKFAKNGVSKPIAAQYLAERLQSKNKRGELTSDNLRGRLPKYLVAAIDYVTGTGTKDESPSKEVLASE
ncbi:MAG: AAA family ATPase [Deltaproteobacteria bacterium]|nr:AAA family ATPase [Deltaproteobacteria bacterium]